MRFGTHSTRGTRRCTVSSPINPKRAPASCGCESADMAIKHRRDAADGLTTVHALDVHEPLSERQKTVLAKDLATLYPDRPAGGLAWRLRYLEGFWRTHEPPRRDARGRVVLPAQLTPAWYAREILFLIKGIRVALAADEPLSPA